ncbi:MAG: HAMP domain-containing histidine kinase [Anaerolineae bacterium]|nr:HAMP domain-containing histidine kinase [Anaerolineae bacterium]
MGFIVVLGWLFDIALFKSLLPGLATMKANTAFTFILGGGALISFNPPATQRWQHSGLICATVMTLLGIVTLAQHILGWNLGIDQLVFKDPQTAPAAFPGRPSLSTAFNILLTGTALLLIGLRRTRWSQIPALLAGAIGLVALLGYLYGVSSLYQVSLYSSMAVHTALTFMILNLGILFAYPDTGMMRVFTDKGTGGMTARRLLPTAVLIPAVIGFLIDRGMNASMFDIYFALALFAVASIAIFTGVIWWNARAIAESEMARQGMEAAKQESDEQFKVIFDESLDVIMIVDGQKGIILHSNAALEWTLGYAVETLVGSHFSTLFPKDPDLSRDEFMNHIHTYGHIFLSQSFQRNDGSVALMDLTAQIIPWNQDRAVMVTLRDVTERKRMEEEILKSEMLRIELEKDREFLNLKEEFIATVSHDFRTPLTVILTSSEILENYYERLTPDRRKEQLGRIRQQVFYMKELLDDVLILSKDRLQVDFKPSPLTLDQFCKGLFETIRLTNGGKHRFIFRSEGEFDSLPMDEKLLQRILVNLLTNAVKYSPNGGDVCLELSREDNTVLLQITDQGRGIPPEKMARLYEPFLRGNNTADIPGTGLGMAIVYQSVRAHGGTIDVQSVVNQGTTIKVRLPV